MPSDGLSQEDAEHTAMALNRRADEREAASLQ
jgi:hypothetical protein